MKGTKSIQEEFWEWREREYIMKDPEDAESQPLREN